MEDPFDLKFVRGKISGIWHFVIEVPLFLNIARVGKKGWDKRLKEELEKIEYIKKLKKEHYPFSKIYQDPENPRIFHVEETSEQDGEIKFKLRLPIRYPFVPPYAEEYYHGKYSFYSYSDHGRVACLDKINDRWNKEGRYGIAHFLAMLGYYTAIAKYNVKLTSYKKKSKKRKK